MWGNIGHKIRLNNSSLWNAVIRRNIWWEGGRVQEVIWPSSLNRCNLCKSRTEDRLYSSKWATPPRMLIVHTQTNYMTSKTDCKTWASEESTLALYLTSILSVRWCRVVTLLEKVSTRIGKKGIVGLKSEPIPRTDCTTRTSLDGKYKGNTWKGLDCPHLKMYQRLIYAQLIWHKHDVWMWPSL